MAISPIPIDEAVFTEELTKGLDERRTQLSAFITDHPSQDMTLVAVPNITFEPSQVLATFRKFGSAQPYGTYVHLPLFEQYSGEEHVVFFSSRSFAGKRNWLQYWALSSPAFGRDRA